jgi:FimV-like protein
VPKVQLNTDEQKVRLNLARSYIKIKDFETARILLNDLVDLGASADQDVFNQASALLLEIS